MRVAIFPPNWLGDAVMALPAMGAIRRHFADHTVIAVARPSVAALFKAVPGVDVVVAIEGSRRVESVRGARADVAVLLPNSFASAWLARRAGIAERWGYAADFRRLLLTRAVSRSRGGHHADYYGRLVEGLGFGAVPVGAVPLGVSEGARQSADRLLASRGCRPDDRLVGVAPGAAYGSAKRWPAERFAGLVAMLERQAGVVPVLLGGAADRGVAREVERALGRMEFGRDASPDGRARPAGASRWMNLVGETSLPELLAVARRCSAFVSNDSGAMHAAAAVGTPVTALFGATNERATSPIEFGGRSLAAGGHRIVTAAAWCRPCMLRECPIDHRCMRGIGVAEVFATVMDQLGAVERHDAAGSGADGQANTQ